MFSYNNKGSKRSFAAFNEDEKDEGLYHKQIKRKSRDIFVANNKSSDQSLTSSDDDSSYINVSTSDEISSENSSSKSNSDVSVVSKRSIPKRNGSPSFKERRRITSARKKPTPYDRVKFIQKNKKAFSSSSDESSRSTTPDSPFIRQTLKEHCFS